METVHTTPDRPIFVIDSDGWRVYISVHDDTYRREYAEKRQAVIDSHPDKHGPFVTLEEADRIHKAHLKAKEAFAYWKEKQEKWYAQYKHPKTGETLTPPSIRVKTEKLSPDSIKLGTNRQQWPQQICAVLQDGKPHTKAEVERIVGRKCSTKTWTAALIRLRRRGAHIVTEYRHDGARGWRLLVFPREPHSHKTPSRLLTLLQERPYTRKELEEKLGIRSCHQAIVRLRRRGILVKLTTDSPPRYRLDT